MATAVKTLALVFIDVLVVYLLVRYVPRSRFHALKWPLVAASGIFWAVFATILLWVFWESYYQNFEPWWARWVAPIAGVEYLLVTLLFWWLAQRLPGPSTLYFCVLGGLESIPEHLLGIYVFKILSLPILASESALSILVFAVFEYVLYWSAVVGLALLLEWLVRRRRRVLALLGGSLVALLLSGCALSDAESIAPKIVYGSNRDGNLEIYVMNADGSGQMNLSHNPAVDNTPAWFPDHKQIAFSSNRTGNFEIYSMNADGTSVLRLTDNPGFDGFPACSPDGDHIAFQSNRAGNFDIYVMDADGSDVMQLTHSAAFDGCPAWSPDGARIAFVSGRDGNSEIYVMNVDGSNQVNLSRQPSDEDYPAWSPDGEDILYTSDLSGETQVYIMNSEGFGQKNLSDHPGVNDYPAWSDDGQQIIFQSLRDGNPQIYRMNVDGSGQRRLTWNSAVDWYADW